MATFAYLTTKKEDLNYEAAFFKKARVRHPTFSKPTTVRAPPYSTCNRRSAAMAVAAGNSTVSQGCNDEHPPTIY